MKNIFKYIVSVFVGAMALAACQQQEIAPLGTEISVNPAALSVAGQSAEAETVTVTADGDWVAVVPKWITAAPAYGSAGETTVTLTFADNLDEDKTLAAARKATVLFSVNAKSAELVVEQAGDPNKAPAEVKLVTCAEFNAAADGEGPFQLIGTITNIEQISPSSAYNNGNLTITDETGSVYLYRVGPGEGNKLEELGLAVGDKITVEGKKGSYGGSPQMAQGGVILNVEKSLISVTKVVPETLPIEGGEFVVTLMCKGEGIEVVIPETATWLTVVSKEHSGELAVVVLSAAANEGGNRTQDVEFVTTLNGTEYKSVVTVSQTGAIQEATAAEINAAEDGTALYKLTGYITKIVKADYGNLYIKDATGEVYVYGTLDAEGGKQNFASLGINEGDIVTVVGPKASYNGSPQMSNVSVEKHVPVQDVTVQAFLDAEKNDNVYYRLTGKLKGMEKAGAYGNIYVEDETAEAYVYGVLAGWGGSKGKFDELVEATGLAEGDIITVVGTRSAYNDKPQMANAFYVSHTPGQADEPETPENPETPTYSIDGKQWVGALDYVEGDVVFDFGYTEEGFLVVAAPGLDGEYVAYMLGAYELDETSGKIVFSQYDIEWDEFMDPVEYSYSNLTENSVDVTADALGGTVSLTLADREYEITLGGGENTGPAGPIENGEYWFFNATKVMAPLAEDATAGFLPAGDVINGASTEKNIFTLTYDPDMSYYTIQDSYGRYLGQTDETGDVAVTYVLPTDETYAFYLWCVEPGYGDGAYDIYNAAYYFDLTYSAADNKWILLDGGYEYPELLPTLVKAENPVEEPTDEPAEPEAGAVLTLTNAEICAAMTSTSTSYTNYTIESASGVWTVNASQNQNNTYLQCRGKNGAYILTPEFDKDIKSVTLYFSTAKSVYADNIYCVFPSTWTVPTTVDTAYPEDGNVGRAVTDGSYSLTIPVDAGNKQVYISLIRTNAYYIDHIDVAF